MFMIFFLFFKLSPFTSPEYVIFLFFSLSIRNSKSILKSFLHAGTVIFLARVVGYATRIPHDFLHPACMRYSLFLPDFLFSPYPQIQWLLNNSKLNVGWKKLSERVKWISNDRIKLRSRSRFLDSLFFFSALAKIRKKSDTNKQAISHTRKHQNKLSEREIYFKHELERHGGGWDDVGEILTQFAMGNWLWIKQQ